MIHIHSVKSDDLQAHVVATADTPITAAPVLSYLLCKMACDILMDHNTGTLDVTNWDSIKDAIATYLHPTIPKCFTVKLTLNGEQPDFRFSVSSPDSLTAAGEGTVHTDRPQLQAV